MTVQFTHPRKTLITIKALEWTVGLVEPAVIAQTARVCKPFAASFAFILLRADVCAAQVLLHIVQSRKHLSTDRTSINSSVHATVVRVFPTPEKLLSARGAAVGFLAGMVAPVFKQLAGRDELLGANVTNKRTLARMDSTVNCHRPQAGKPSPANLAVERFITRVSSPVFHVLLHTYKRLAAVFADVDHPFSSNNRRSLGFRPYIVAGGDFHRNVCRIRVPPGQLIVSWRVSLRQQGNKHVGVFNTTTTCHCTFCFDIGCDRHWTWQCIWQFIWGKSVSTGINLLTGKICQIKL